MAEGITASLPETREQAESAEKLEANSERSVAVGSAAAGACGDCSACPAMAFCPILQMRNPSPQVGATAEVNALFSIETAVDLVEGDLQPAGEGDKFLGLFEMLAAKRDCETSDSSKKLDAVSRETDENSATKDSKDLSPRAPLLSSDSKLGDVPTGKIFSGKKSFVVTKPQKDSANEVSESSIAQTPSAYSTPEPPSTGGNTADKPSSSPSAQTNNSTTHNRAEHSSPDMTPQSVVTNQHTGSTNHGGSTEIESSSNAELTQPKSRQGDESEPIQTIPAHPSVWSPGETIAVRATELVQFATIPEQDENETAHEALAAQPDSAPMPEISSFTTVHSEPEQIQTSGQKVAAHEPAQDLTKEALHPFDNSKQDSPDSLVLSIVDNPDATTKNATNEKTITPRGEESSISTQEHTTVAQDKSAPIEDPDEKPSERPHRTPTTMIDKPAAVSVSKDPTLRDKDLTLAAMNRPEAEGPVPKSADKDLSSEQVSIPAKPDFINTANRQNKITHQDTAEETLAPAKENFIFTEKILGSIKNRSVLAGKDSVLVNEKTHPASEDLAFTDKNPHPTDKETILLREEGRDFTYKDIAQATAALDELIEPAVETDNATTDCPVNPEDTSSTTHQLMPPMGFDIGFYLMNGESQPFLATHTARSFDDEQIDGYPHDEDQQNPLFVRATRIVGRISHTVGHRLVGVISRFAIKLIC